MKRKTTRRTFLEKGAKAGLVLPFLSSAMLGCNEKSEAPEKEVKDHKLNILILGGTSFLGPHQIAYALGKGHAVSTFTRGKTMPTVHQELFKNVEQLIGDRENNLKALENRKWDVVIDNSGRNTEWTKSTANLLKDNVGIYMYTSSTGVYYPYLGNNFNEEKEVLLAEPENPSEEEKLEFWYGVMKAQSEMAARTAFGDDRTIVVRPTYMVGPADKTNRFIYWPVRLSRGGETLVPGKENDRVQYVDVRDVAEWMIRLIENKNSGTYNAVGPENAQNMYAFVEEAQKAFDVESNFVKINDYEFLKENEVHYIVPWIMPEGKNIGSAMIDNRKAISNGLTFRPLLGTMQDTHRWWYSDALTQEKRDVFELKENSILMREKEIIALWKKRNS
ncbi:MAG: NAD-dependent epimerase/dehydratase family protein [Bacteroidota bacterium]